MYRVRPKWLKWPFWRVLKFAKLANFRRVLKFDKFAGEWPLLNLIPRLPDMEMNSLMKFKKSRNKNEDFYCLQKCIKGTIKYDSSTTIKQAPATRHRCTVFHQNCSVFTEISKTILTPCTYTVPVPVSKIRIFEHRLCQCLFDGDI